MTHDIVWTYQRQQVTAEATCDDPECLNRYVCADAPCEVYYDVRREPDGSITHKPWGDEHPAINRHRMDKSDGCSFADFLNADPYTIPELNESTISFEIGRTAIEPIWQGDDGATWLRPEDRKQSGRPRSAT